MTTLDAASPLKRHAHVLPYMALAVMAGTTAGMLRALSPVFAIHLGASNAQIGMISSLESLGMAAMTLPAGVLVSRYGPRLVYVIASLIITSVYCIVPWSHSWIVLGIGLGIGGSCMPFRIVSVSGSFLERLKELGRAKAGWYSGSGTVGTLLVGPVLATFLLTRSGTTAGYMGTAFLFACMGIGGTFTLARRPPPGPSPTFLQSFAESARLLRDPVVSAICTIEVSTNVVLAFFSAFIVVTAIRVAGLSEPAAISVRLFEGIVAVATMFLGGFFVKNRPLVRFYRISLMLIVAGFALLSLARTYPALVLATLLLGSGLGITSLINIIRLGAAEAPKSRIASLQLFSSMGGSFIGALLGGVLSKYLGLEGMFLAGAFLYAVLSYRWCFSPARPV
ncbi:MAG TPA: MFS transporter [Rhizomicrobium sp.]|nr:MFS transporter [Rhizomicrobium sp.]